MNEPPLWFTLTTITIQTLAAVVAIVAAFVGFSAWRKQLRATEDHNLARGLLIAAINLRDSIIAARSNIMLLPEPTADQAWEKDWYRKAERQEYGRRINAATSARSALEAKIIEAQSIWDEPVRDWFMSLIQRHTDMVVDIDTYFELTDPRIGQLTPDNVALLESARRTLFAHTSSKPDTFESQLNIAIDSIREQMKSRMLKR